MKVWAGLVIMKVERNFEAFWSTILKHKQKTTSSKIISLNYSSILYILSIYTLINKYLRDYSR